MRKFYFLLLVIILGNFLNAQNENLSIKSIYQANTSNGGRIIRTVFDNAQNNITVGFSNGSFSFGNESFSNGGIDDMFIYKSKNSNGDKVWIKTINAGAKGSIRPNYIKIGSQNEIYVLANFEGTITENNQQFTSDDMRNAILLKFSKDGFFLWGKKLPYKEMSLQGIDMAVTQDEIFFILNENDVYTIDNHNGNINSNRAFTDTWLTAVKSDNGKIYLAGYSNYNVTIDQQDLGRSGFILQVNNSLSISSFVRITAGNTGYVYDLNDILIDNGYIYLNIKLVNDNKISVTGENNFNTSFSSDNTTSISVWLAKIKSDFTSVEWNKFLGMQDAFLLFGLKFYKTNETRINLYLDSQNSVNISYPNYGYIQTNNSALLPINSITGDLISGNNFFNITSKSAGSRIDYNYYNNQEYIAYNYNNLKIFSRNVLDPDFQNLRNLDINSTPGEIDPVFLKRKSSGDIFQAANYSGHINYRFGNSLPVNENSNNIVLSKILPDGSEQWQINALNFSRIYPNTPYEKRISINEDNEFLSAFNCFQGNCHITDAEKSDLISAANTETLIKFDNSGKILWSKIFESINSSSMISNLSLYYDNAGNIIIHLTGRGDFKFGDSIYHFNNSNSSEFGFYIFKLTSSGNLIFAKNFNYGSSSHQISFDLDNNIYIFFAVNPELNYSDPFYFDNVSIENNLIENPLIFLKLTPQGNVSTGKNLSLYIDSNPILAVPFQGYDIGFDGNDFVLSGVTSYFKNLKGENLNDPYHIESTNSVSYRSLINKISKEGEILWSKPIFVKSSSIGTRGTFDMDHAGNIYYTDQFYDAVTSDNQEITFNDYSKYIQTVLKFTSGGSLDYYKKLSEYSAIKEISSNRNNQYAISVSNPDIFSVSTSTSQNEIENHLIYNQNGDNYIIMNIEPKDLNIAEAYKKRTFIYPNPASEVLHLKSNNKIEKVQIFDMTGKEINTFYNKDTIIVTHLQKGMYILKIYTEKEVLSSKFIKK